MKNEETNKEIRLLSEQELGEVSGAGWVGSNWAWWEPNSAFINKPWFYPAYMS